MSLGLILRQARSTSVELPRVKAQRSKREPKLVGLRSPKQKVESQELYVPLTDIYCGRSFNITLHVIKIQIQDITENLWVDWGNKSQRFRPIGIEITYASFISDLECLDYTPLIKQVP